MAPLTSTSKTPSITHAVSAGLLVALLAVLLAAAPRSAPPAIAQIAPNAVQQIKEAPIEQALEAEGGETDTGTDGDGASPGDGEGGANDAEAAASLGPTPDVAASGGIEEPRTKSCLGSPVPRQIEDPQSPPCAPFFSGDNGGATSRGVTRDTIKVALPDQNVDTPYLHALVDFFNERFQFYGRKLEVTTVPGYDTSAGCDPAVQSGAAAAARDQLDAFLSFDTAGCGGLYYAREAAARGIVVTNYQPLYDEQELRDLHPYVWSYPMSGDRMYAALGRWTCQRLVGGAAQHAGDPSMRPKPRKFGVLLADTVRPEPADFSPLIDALRACNAPVDEADIRTIQTGSDNDAEESVARDVVLRWKLSEVTTAVILTHSFFSTETLFPVATAQGFLPEWVVSDYWEQDNLANQHKQPSTQQGAMMGITVKPPHHTLADDPAVQALKSIDPSLLGNADADTALARQVYIQRIYKQLLLMATGIQAAGPKLNPETFARGMQTTVFPNPDTALNEGRIGMPSSHSATLDFSEMWYSTTTRGPFRAEAPGAWCFVDNGRRRSAVDIPKGDEPFFGDNTCRPSVG